MNNQSGQEIALFGEAVSLPPAERAAFLDRACAGNEQLRRRVEALLQAHDRAGDFLAKPSSEALSARSEISIGEKPGDRIGRYRLLQQIGEGVRLSRNE